MDFATSLRVLTMLTDALSMPEGMAASLDRITEMTGTLMETQQTAILLRDEDRRKLLVRTSIGIDNDQVQAGHSLGVDMKMQSILWRITRTRQIGSLDSRISGIGFPILATPLRVKGEIIGLLLTGKANSGKIGFDEVSRKLFEVIASFAALVIENAKVYDYLQQDFRHRAHELVATDSLDSGTMDATEHLMVESLKNPNRVVRQLAGSFYKELVHAGFSPDHIAIAASEILGCIATQDQANVKDEFTVE